MVKNKIIVYILYM